MKVSKPEYEKICAVIDHAKDEGELDTDEYASQILEALGLERVSRPVPFDTGPDFIESPAGELHVGDTVLVRLSTPGPGGPVSDKPADVKWYKRNFTRLVTGTVARIRPSLAINYRVDGIADEEAWRELLGGQQELEELLSDLGNPWTDYEAQPGQVEEILHHAQH